MLVVSKFLVPKGYNGLTVFPFIFIKEPAQKVNKVLINHEKIHLRQQAELLVLPFFIWYGLEFLVRFVQYRQWHEAYRNISFEREAYAKEKDLGYLEARPLWHFVSFFLT